MKRTILGLAVVALAVPSFAIVLDDMSGGSILITDSFAYDTEMVSADRTRYGALDLDGVGLMDHTNGILFVELDTGTEGFAIYGHIGGLLNGAPASGPGGLATSDAAAFSPSVDWTGVTTIEVDFAFSDQNTGSIGFFIYSGGGPGLDNATFVPSSLVTIPSGASTVSIDVSSFGATLSNVTGWGIGMDLPNGNDVAITEIRAVPEPASMIALGAGLAALAARRRRAN